MRLEQGWFHPRWAAPPLFQFHKGAIRTFGLPDSPIAHYYFNSIKVRLEQGLILSRLFYMLLFQFHKGAIRTA